MGEDTGKIELERILKCLKVNGYKYVPNTLEQVNDFGLVSASFIKDVPEYSDKSDSTINDRFIKINIEFDSDFDYKNEYTDEGNHHLFKPDKSNKFIQNLIAGTYDRDIYGGSRKRIIKRKNTTRRNRKTKK